MLETTPQTFGGRRWWFVCPRTGVRAAKLHLPNGAFTFASRLAYRLAYARDRLEALRERDESGTQARQMRDTSVTARRGRIYPYVLIPEEAAPQFRDDVAPRNGMMSPPDSEMIAPPITE